MYRAFLRLFNPILDKNEKIFTEKNKDKSKFILAKKSNKTIFIETHASHIYIRIIEKLISNNPNHKYIGFYPNKFIFKFKEFIMIFPFLYRIIIYRKHFKKYKLLYNSIGVSKVYRIEDLDFILRLKNFFLAFKYILKIKNNKQLLDLKIKKIKVGDLIYDSYVRFHNKPTLNNKNYASLIFYITRVLNSFLLFNKMNHKYDFKMVFSEYASYVNHGSIVRWFSAKGIDTFTSGTDQKLFKKQNINHPYESIDHFNYKDDFSKFTNKKEIIENSLKSLDKRFNGIPDLNYMFKSSYKTNSDDFNKQLDGVVFMHDFFDCIHIFRNLIFDDFYQWILFLINFISENKLNIGIKPHPLERQESIVITKYLIKKHPNIHWIDSEISNTNIFNSGIKFGISVYGTVLTELAYHNIIPISCGDNPTSSFSFTFEAKSIEEYRELILGYKNLKMPKDYIDQIGQFYFMHYINNSTDIDLKIDNELLKKRYIETDSSVINFTLKTRF